MKKFIRDTVAMLVAIAAIAVQAFADAPANDNFSNAEQLSGIRVSVERNNLDATKEIGEPDHAFNAGGKSVWFKWTAPMTRVVQISTARSSTNINTLLGVYVGTELNSLNDREHSDDILGSLNRRSHAILDAEAGVTYYIAVDGATLQGAPAASGSFKLDIRPYFPIQGADQDGDGFTNITVFRPSTGDWYINGRFDSESGEVDMFVRHWGVNGDIPVVAAKHNFIDTTVFRPSAGVWYNQQGCCSTEIAQWGIAGDIPVSEMFTGARDSYFAVFRPSNGTWYVHNPLAVPANLIVQFGQAGDIPVPGNYTPDGLADIAVFRPSNGVWYILERKPIGPPVQVRVMQFGLPADKPVPGDYDGDGILDLAIYRPSTGTWWMLRSSDNQQHAFKWGLADDIPTTGDYDGDGIFDFAVFRPSTGDWYIRNSETGSVVIKHFGTTGDIPVTSNVR